ncbi:MAG: T9SS type A sorting domain-containing protein, partial [Saprospiraceae bacterium]|nr:T9SS type A sorting domain-containing protein [Saprospiraceae bacterium]MDZ4703931.1 T9SS type A sorting domain-containing protein [Saprospiraceae bacterium]
KLSWCAVQAICEYVLPGPSPGTPTFFNNMDGCNGMWEDIIPACLVSSEEEKVTAQMVQVFPNPANNEFNVILPEGAGSFAVSILDMTGSLLGTNLSGSENLRMDISHLPSGIYLLEIKMAGGIIAEKIIKH